METFWRPELCLQDDLFRAWCWVPEIARTVSLSLDVLRQFPSAHTSPPCRSSGTNGLLLVQKAAGVHGGAPTGVRTRGRIAEITAPSQLMINKQFLPAHPPPNYLHLSIPISAFPSTEQETAGGTKAVCNCRLTLANVEEGLGLPHCGHAK